MKPIVEAVNEALSNYMMGTTFIIEEYDGDCVQVYANHFSITHLEVIIKVLKKYKQLFAIRASFNLSGTTPKPELNLFTFKKA